MKLSAVIPVYSEATTIAKVVEQVLEVALDHTLGGIEKEIVIVNDGSTDETTGYKIFRTDLLRSLDLQSPRLVLPKGHRQDSAARHRDPRGPHLVPTMILRRGQKDLLARRPGCNLNVAEIPGAPQPIDKGSKR